MGAEKQMLCIVMRLRMTRIDILLYTFLYAFAAFGYGYFFHKIINIIRCR